MRIFILGLIVLTLSVSSVVALTLAGTGDSEVLLQHLALEYQRIYPDRTVEVPPSVGSSGGIRMLLQGRTDLARVARPLSESEVQHGLKGKFFALVPIVFVANLPQDCLSDLNSEQVLKIFSGDYQRWSQLGECPDQKIFLARREYDDSSNRILFDKIAGLREIGKPAGRIIYTTPETFQTIESHPYTLGYLPLSQVKNSTLTRFSFDGVVASAESLVNNSYALKLPLALVWKNTLSAESRHFVQFLESNEAQAVIRAYGAVPTMGQAL